MLAELSHLGLLLTQMIGVVCVLWGAILLFFAVLGGRGGAGALRGVLLMVIGYWAGGLGQWLGSLAP